MVLVKYSQQKAAGMEAVVSKLGEILVLRAKVM